MTEPFENMDEYRRQAKYPLVKACDMPSDLREEVHEICIMLMEKYPTDYEKCTQTIKEALDKKIGGPWHVIAGTNFSYNITHKATHLQYLFVGGKTGILVWKA